MPTTTVGSQEVPGAAPRRPRGQVREQAILAAVVELVSELGYERVTVDAIATRARASKATIYRRWPSKADLVAAALRRQAQGDGSIDIADTGSLHGDLLAAVHSATRALTGTDGPSLLSLVDAVRDDPVLRAQVRDQIEGGSAQLGATIASRATARGELDPDTDVGQVLTLAIAHLFLTLLLHGQPPTADDQVQLVDTVLLPVLTAAR